MHPMGLKLKLKVLGKEFEAEPFFKRVFLNKTRKNFHKSVILRRFCFLVTEDTFQDIEDSFSDIV